MQISDIRSKQFGQDGAALDEVLKNTSYDVVVMTGDLVAPDNDATGFYQALDYFGAQGKPVYYITGEDDPEITEIAEDGSFGLTQWARTAQQKGAVLLDIPVQLAGGDSDTALWLMPASALVLDTQSTLDSLAARLEDEQLSDGAVQSILYRKARYEAFADAMAKRQHNDLTVMLSHMPCLEASLQSESSTAIFSEADLILSTREKPEFRLRMAESAVSHLSAGSQVDPGGYQDHLDGKNLGQFSMNDQSSVEQVCAGIRRHGMVPVFKDWDRSFQ